MPKLYPLFPAKKLTKILVADKPPGQNGKILELTEEQFTKKFGFQYTESVWGTEKQRSRAMSSWDALLKKGTNSQFDANIAYRLLNPRQDLAVCFISEEVGYGLFATTDIPVGTILNIYSGEIIDESKSGYTYGAVDKDGNETQVCAEKIGGLARFMQHLPYSVAKQRSYLIDQLKKSPEKIAKYMKISLQEAKEKLKEKDVDNKFLGPFIDAQLSQLLKEYDYEFEAIDFNSQQIKENVATCNVSIKDTKFCDCLMSVIVVDYPIKAGDQIGFPYGPEYWEYCGINPELFLNDGTVLSKNCYKRLEIIDKTNPYFGKPGPTLFPMKNDKDELQSIPLKDLKIEKNNDDATVYRQG